MILFANDSTSVDTVQTYEIPEMVAFRDGIWVTGEIMPDYYEQLSADLLLGHAVEPFLYGFGRVGALYTKGRKPSYTGIYVDGRPLHGHPLGYVSQAELPLHFFDKVSYGNNAAGAELSAINFESRVNRYEKPYSYAHFEFGSFQSSLYGMDLTRALTNNAGFYLSGQFYKTAGHRVNGDAQILSIYSNVYLDCSIPMRIDVSYVSNEYGFPGSVELPLNGREEDRNLDITYTIASGNAAGMIFYDYQNIDYVDTVNGRSLAVRTDQYGALAARHDTLMGVILDYGTQGFLTTLDGGAYLPTVLSEAEVWFRVGLNYGRFFAQTEGRIGTANYHESFFCPKQELNMKIVGSLYLSAAISRAFRAPSDFERWAPFDTLIPYFSIAGNSSLEPEYCWTEEIGLRGKGLLLNYYHCDYLHYIAPAHFLSSPSLQYINFRSWKTSGIEGFASYPLRLYNADSSVTTELVFSGSFNALLSGDSMPNVPVHCADAVVSIKRTGKRFGFGVALRGEYAGVSRDISGEEFPGYAVYSMAGLVKFLSLSCVVRLNNIFDETYAYIPHYPMAPRNYDVSIKWEFWD